MDINCVAISFPNSDISVPLTFSLLLCVPSPQLSLAYSDASPPTSLELPVLRSFQVKKGFWKGNTESAGTIFRAAS